MNAKRKTIVALGLTLSCVTLSAQRGAAPEPPKSPKAAAPVDLTGYWVSLVTEDWRWRMVTPIKGDSASVPINQAAKKIMMDWDPAKDEAAGDQCKAYGAPAIMRVPGRLHITWQDEGTLTIETDAGSQTRVLHFSGEVARTAPSWQGYSSARWDGGLAPAGGQLPIGLGQRQGVRSRSLEVITTNLKPGYLRKNGVPYSAKTTVTEYFDRNTMPNGDVWFTVTTKVEDPVYARGPYLTTTDFKKLPDASGWNPTPCSSR